jgi:hypothetical protein
MTPRTIIYDRLIPIEVCVPSRKPDAAEGKVLAQVERFYRQAVADAEKSRERRDWHIRAALSAGWTQTQVADVTGLTCGRIGQIASGK